MTMSTKNSEQFNIRWNNYTVVIQSVFRKLLKDKKLTDITLACEGGSIKCHRIVLSACSPYFEELMSQYPEEKHIILFLKDVKYWTIQYLVHFMYYGEMSVKQTELPIIIATAESLQIRGLSGDAPDIVDSDVEHLSDDEDTREFSDAVDARVLQLQAQAENSQTAIVRRQQTVTSMGRRGSGSSEQQQQPRSLLRPHVPPQHSQGNFTSRGANANHASNAVGATSTAPKKRTMISGPHSAGPPKLTKITRLEDKDTNGTVASTSASASTLKQQQSAVNSMSSNKSQSATPPSLEKFVNSVDFGSDEEEDGFPHETSIEAERDDINVKDETRSLSSVATGANYNGEDSGSDVEESTYAPSGGRRFSNKYPKEVRDSVLSNLKSGMSIKECTDASGIPRKTISKWRNQNLQDITSGIKEDGEVDDESVISNNSVIRLPPVPVGPVIDASDRADRLQKATELALSGITVRQAAAHFGIPRTTLCAYMKRRGIAGKKANNTPSVPSYSNSSGRRIVTNFPRKIYRNNAQTNSNDFPLFGLSDIVDELGDQYDEEMEEQEQEQEEYDYEDPEQGAEKVEYDSN